MKTIPEWHHDREAAQDEGRFLGNAVGNMINTLLSDMTLVEKRADIAERKDIFERQATSLEYRIAEIECALDPQEELEERKEYPEAGSTVEQCILREPPRQADGR